MPHHAQHVQLGLLGPLQLDGLRDVLERQCEIRLRQPLDVALVQRRNQLLHQAQVRVLHSGAAQLSF